MLVPKPISNSEVHGSVGGPGAHGTNHVVRAQFEPEALEDALNHMTNSFACRIYEGLEWHFDRLRDLLAQGGAGSGRGNGFTTARSAAGFVAGRERTLEALAELERGQDYYAAVRSAYRQRRAVDIRNEEATGTTVPRRLDGRQQGR